jgi:hypothetical protein
MKTLDQQQELKELLFRYCEKPERILAVLESNVLIGRFKESDLFSREQVGILSEGLARLVLKNKLSKTEQTIEFFDKGDVIYLPQTIDENNEYETQIEFLKHSKVHMTRKEILKTRFGNTSIASDFLRSMLKVQMKKRNEMAYLASIPMLIDRYNTLRIKKPHLLNEVHQYILASFLGTTPNSLSRAKSQYYLSIK